jgi:MFS family permease
MLLACKKLPSRARQQAISTPDFFTASNLEMYDYAAQPMGFGEQLQQPESGFSRVCICANFDKIRGRAMRRQPRFFYGWVVVATAALGLFLGAFPVVVSSFSIFFKSYIQEFHSGRGAISLAFTIHNFIAAFLAVFIGRLSDRFGARKVILPGLGILGAILLSAEAIGSKVWQLYVFYSALGAVGGATTSVPYALVVSRWFNRRRGLALGLMMVGLGAGSIAMPPVAQRLIAGYGWRGAFAIAGCAILLIPMPVVGLFLKESPQRMGLLPDGASKAPAVRGESEGLTWPEIRNSRTFWLMIAACTLAAASVHACFIHVPQLILDRGASASVAAGAASVVGFATLVGRIGTGYFLDRLFGPYVALFVFANAALGIALLWTGIAGVPALSGAFLVGVGFGAEVDIIAYLMGRYFGLRSLGTAFGFGFGALVLAGGLGPLIMGFAFDHTGSYRVPLTGFFIATVVAAVQVGRLGPYRFSVTRQAEKRTVFRSGVEA